MIVEGNSRCVDDHSLAREDDQKLEYTNYLPASTTYFGMLIKIFFFRISDSCRGSSTAILLLVTTLDIFFSTHFL